MEIDELELQLSFISHNIVVKHINQRETNSEKQWDEQGGSCGSCENRGKGGCVETG